MACDRRFILTKGLKNRPWRTAFFKKILCHLSATVRLHLHCLHSAPNAVFFMIVCHMEKGKRDTQCSLSSSECCSLEEHSRKLILAALQCV